ncbi:MAG TPA: FtsX-like permease family protein [Hanamia sp.]|nr:FtsX-like permease family protein [Hanamia sp.]
MFELFEVPFIENKFKSWQPQVPFDYHFLDEEYNNLYKSEMTYGKVLSIFSFIAILLACMGLFGLSAFMIRQRVKEIGVRKVLGASVPGITILISKDFLKLVIIAMLVASPIAWWVMNRWLRDFAYRISISWHVFEMAGVIAILIALITVSFQSIKAAMANPVNSLRSE